jgi:hypothetical protein
MSGLGGNVGAVVDAVAELGTEILQRGHAVRGVLASLRIEGLELDAIPAAIVKRFADGEIPLPEMTRQLHAYSDSIY